MRCDKSQKRTFVHYDAAKAVLEEFFCGKSLEKSLSDEAFSVRVPFQKNVCLSARQLLSQEIFSSDSFLKFHSRFFLLFSFKYEKKAPPPLSFSTSKMDPRHERSHNRKDEKQPRKKEEKSGDVA